MTAQATLTLLSMLDPDLLCRHLAELSIEDQEDALSLMAKPRFPQERGMIC
jgi:hypothetical protein